MPPMIMGVSLLAPLVHAPATPWRAGLADNLANSMPAEWHVYISATHGAQVDITGMCCATQGRTEPLIHKGFSAVCALGKKFYSLAGEVNHD